MHTSTYSLLAFEKSSMFFLLPTNNRMGHLQQLRSCAIQKQLDVNCAKKEKKTGHTNIIHTIYVGTLTTSTDIRVCDQDYDFVLYIVLSK